MGLNTDASASSGVLLIDEIEVGLEPYRIRNLLKKFRSKDDDSQIILTTHSPTVITACQLEEVFITRSKNDITTIISPYSDSAIANEAMQKQLRKNPEAFLSRKILIGEGKTEMGFAVSIDKYMARNGNDFAYNGAEIADGVGDNLFECARIFKNCGYKVGVLLDSDKELANHHKLELSNVGVRIFDWDEGNAIEDQLFLDAPFETVNALVNIAAQEHGTDKIQQSLTNGDVPFDISDDKITINRDTKEARKALGKIANETGWFKRVDRGEKMGDAIFANFDVIGEDTTLHKNILAIIDWIKACE